MSHPTDREAMAVVIHRNCHGKLTWYECLEIAAAVRAFWTEHRDTLAEVVKPTRLEWTTDDTDPDGYAQPSLIVRSGNDIADAVLAFLGSDPTAHAPP